jgi:peptidoglycan/LPS O-acetylase OafA/YrhL
MISTGRSAPLTIPNEAYAPARRAGERSRVEGTGRLNTFGAKPSTVRLQALDGLRTIAIVLVVVYHSLNSMTGVTRAQTQLLRFTGLGWIGVDLFFILSGFLITGILLDVRSSRHALRNFYARRLLRIVPLYIAFLLFSLWIASALGTSSAAETAQLHQTQLWYWSYSVNLLIALHNWSGTTLPMVHLWSLAVEEQFYFLWSFAVLFLSPVTIKRAALGCIAAAELFRLLVILHGADGQVNFVLLPARMDALAAGAFLACAFRDPVLWERVLRARQALTLAALVLLLVTIVYRHTIDIQAPLEQLTVFPALVALGLVAVSGAAAGVTWLSGAAMRFVAKISYGMYVWHLVVMRLIVTRSPLAQSATPAEWWAHCALLVGGTLLGTILVAVVSWHIVEQPFLKLKRFVPNM